MGPCYAVLSCVVLCCCWCLVAVCFVYIAWVFFLNLIFLFFLFFGSEFCEFCAYAGRSFWCGLQQILRHFHAFQQLQPNTIVEDQTRPDQDRVRQTAVSLQFSGRSKQNDSIEDGVGYTACWANFGLAVVVKWLSGYKTTQNAFSSSSTYLLSTSYSQFSKCPSFY